MQFSTLACSPIARAHNMFNTHNHQRLTLFDSMGDQVVMTHEKQTNDKPRNEELLLFAEQQASCFLPFRCAYLSHNHFHFPSTRAPPAARDSWSPMHVGVALPKQMRPVTCTGLLPSAVMHPKATASVGGGTTPRFRQILNSVPSVIHWSCPSFRMRFHFCNRIELTLLAPLGKIFQTIGLH